MLRGLILLIGLGLFTAGLAFPDLIDVSVNGTVSASGTVSAVCNPLVPPCGTQVLVSDGAPPLYTVPFSFSASNTQLGAFSQTWQAYNPISGSLQPYADESTSACFAGPSTFCAPGVGDALYAQLSGGHTNNFSYFTTTENESVTFSFDLTQESVVTLYSSSFQGSPPNGGEVLDATGANILLQVPVNTDASTVLAPGFYEVYASTSGGAFGSPLAQGTVTDSQLYLTAQFSPVSTPEPRLELVGVLLVVIFAGCGLSRRNLHLEHFPCKQRQ